MADSRFDEARRIVSDENARIAQTADGIYDSNITILFWEGVEPSKIDLCIEYFNLDENAIKYAPSVFYDVEIDSDLYHLHAYYNEEDQRLYRLMMADPVNTSYYDQERTKWVHLVGETYKSGMSNIVIGMRNVPPDKSFEFQQEAVPDKLTDAIYLLGGTLLDGTWENVKREVVVNENTGLYTVRWFLRRTGDGSDSFGIRYWHDQKTSACELDLVDTYITGINAFEETTYIDRDGHWYHSDDGSTYDSMDGMPATGNLPSDCARISDYESIDGSSVKNRNIVIQTSYDEKEKNWNVKYIIYHSSGVIDFVSNRAEIETSQKATLYIYEGRGLTKSQLDTFLSNFSTSPASGTVWNVEFSIDQDGNYNAIATGVKTKETIQEFDIGDAYISIGTHSLKQPTTNVTLYASDDDDTYHLIAKDPDDSSKTLVDPNRSMNTRIVHESDDTWSWFIIAPKYGSVSSTFGSRYIADSNEVICELNLADATIDEINKLEDRTYIDPDGHWYYSENGSTYTKKDGVDVDPADLPSDSARIVDKKTHGDAEIENRTIRIQSSFSEQKKTWNVKYIIRYSNGVIDFVSSPATIETSKKTTLYIHEGRGLTKSQLDTFLGKFNSEPDSGTIWNVEFSIDADGKYNAIATGVKTKETIQEFDIGDAYISVGTHSKKIPTTDVFKYNDNTDDTEYHLIAEDPDNSGKTLIDPRKPANTRIVHESDDTWSWFIVAPKAGNVYMAFGSRYIADSNEVICELSLADASMDDINKFEDETYIDPDGHWYHAIDGPSTGTVYYDCKDGVEQVDQYPMPANAARIIDSETIGYSPLDMNPLKIENRTVRIQSSYNEQKKTWSVKYLIRYSDGVADYLNGSSNINTTPNEKIKIYEGRGLTKSQLDSFIGKFNSEPSHGTRTEVAFTIDSDGKYNAMATRITTSGVINDFDLGDSYISVGDHSTLKPTTDVSKYNDNSYHLIAKDPNNSGETFIDPKKSVSSRITHEADGTWSWFVVAKKKLDVSDSAFGTRFYNDEKTVVCELNLVDASIDDIDAFEDETYIDPNGHWYHHVKDTTEPALFDYKDGVKQSEPYPAMPDKAARIMDSQTIGLTFPDDIVANEPVNVENRTIKVQSFFDEKEKNWNVKYTIIYSYGTNDYLIEDTSTDSKSPATVCTSNNETVKIYEGRGLTKSQLDSFIDQFKSAPDKGTKWDIGFSIDQNGKYNAIATGVTTSETTQEFDIGDAYISVGNHSTLEPTLDADKYNGNTDSYYLVAGYIASYETELDDDGNTVYVLDDDDNKIPIYDTLADPKASASVKIFLEEDDTWSWFIIAPKPADDVESIGITDPPETNHEDEPYTNGIVYGIKGSDEWRFVGHVGTSEFTDTTNLDFRGMYVDIPAVSGSPGAPADGNPYLTSSVSGRRIIGREIRNIRTDDKGKLSYDIFENIVTAPIQDYDEWFFGGISTRIKRSKGTFLSEVVDPNNKLIDRKDGDNFFTIADAKMRTVGSAYYQVVTVTRYMKYFVRRPTQEDLDSAGIGQITGVAPDETVSISITQLNSMLFVAEKIVTYVDPTRYEDEDAAKSFDGFLFQDAMKLEQFDDVSGGVNTTPPAS